MVLISDDWPYVTQLLWIVGGMHEYAASVFHRNAMDVLTDKFMVLVVLGVVWDMTINNDRVVLGNPFHVDTPEQAQKDCNLALR